MAEQNATTPSDTALSDDQKETLRALVAMIIPASADHGVPGADDPTIFTRIARAASAELSQVENGLSEIDEMSRARHGATFAALKQDVRVEIANAFNCAQSPAVSAIVTITAQCYYSDERVLNALGMDARAPFPKGFEIEQGDWSLLDSVKQRPKFYRKV